MSKRRAELEVSAGGHRVPAAGRSRAAVPAHPGFLRQLGLSQGPPRGRRVAGRGGARGRPREETGLEQPGAAGPDPGHRLAFPLPRPPHPQVLPLLPASRAPTASRAPQVDEGITACQWRSLDEALETAELRQRARRAQARRRDGAHAGGGRGRAGPRGRPRSDQDAAADRGRRRRAAARAAPRCSRSGAPCPRRAPGRRLPRRRRALRRVLERRLVDAIVLAPTAALLPELAELRRRLPGHAGRGLRAVPPRRRRAARWPAGATRVAAVAVEGVDDPVVGEMVVRSSITAARRRALADAPRMLRLTEPLQRAAWGVLLGEVERPVRTTDLARQLRGEPGAPLPAVRRRRRAQSQAGHRSAPASPAPPSCSPTPATPFPRWSGSSTSPRPAT